MQSVGPSFLFGCPWAFLPCSLGKESLLPAFPMGSMCSQRGRHGQTGPGPATGPNLDGGPVPKIPACHQVKPGVLVRPLPRAVPHPHRPPHIPSSRRATFSASSSWRGQTRKPPTGEAGGGQEGATRLLLEGGNVAQFCSQILWTNSWQLPLTQEGGLVMGPEHLGGHRQRATGLGELVSGRSSSSLRLGVLERAFSSELL